MKTLIVLFSLITTSVLKAQPTQQQVLKDIQRTWPGAWGIRFDGGPMETNDGQYYTWSQLAVCTTKTDLAKKYPDALCVVFGSAVYYKLTNGSFQFKHYSAPEGSYGYVGVPGPTEQDIQSWIDRNGGQARVFYKEGAGRISKVHSLRIVPKFFKDYDLNVYAFAIETEYDYVTYGSQVITYRGRYNVEMRKSGSEWYDDLSPELEFGYPVTLRERAIGKAEETELLNNNLEKRSSNASAEAFLSKLPKVDIPANFETPFHQIVHFMDFLRTAGPEQAQAYLYQTMAPRSFVAGSRTRLTTEGQAMMNHVLNVVQNKKMKFSDFFCDDPPMTEYANDADTKELRFLGKLSNYKSRIQVSRKDGGNWKLYYVELNLPKTDEDIAKVKAVDANRPCTFTDKQSVKKFVGIVPDPLAKEATKPKASTWKSFGSAGGNFSVQFPGDVTEKVNPVGKVTYYNYSAPSSDGSLFSAVSVKLERKMTDAEASTMGQNFLKSFLATEKLVSQVPYKKGQGGIEAIIDQKGIYDVRYVVFVVDEYVYQLYVTSHKGKRVETNEHQFFSSFNSGTMDESKKGKKKK